MSHWRDASAIDPGQLRHEARGRWWSILREQDVTLLVSREYEHLLVAVSTTERGPAVSFLPLPHPSGIAFDRRRRRVHVASTRNPNELYEFAPVGDGVLVPVRTTFLPGALYLHDLALVDGKLHGNAVGLNAVVQFEGESYQPAWWPRSISMTKMPLGPNVLQLNSIAAGRTLSESFFSASAAIPSARRPGHLNFGVDGRGVIFSGRTREPIAWGLTRPHSARLSGGTLWVDNSGYGEVGTVVGSGFVPLTRLPGWTRGLALHGRVGFVGTSRVIRRFARYAPGLDPSSSSCGLHAVDLHTGEVLGSLIWPSGNQIFAIEAVPRSLASGLPFRVGRRTPARDRRLFYTSRIRGLGE